MVLEDVPQQVLKLSASGCVEKRGTRGMKSLPRTSYLLEGCLNSVSAGPVWKSRIVFQEELGMDTCEYQENKPERVKDLFFSSGQT